MISAKTFRWTLCPLDHFLALIVQCRIHGTSFESLMEAFSRSLFWNHFFVFFFWPSTGFDEGHIFSGDHIKSLWKIAAVNSDFFVIHRSWITYINIAYMIDEMWLLDSQTHFGHTWPGQGVKAVFLRCPPSWPLVASSSSPSGWRARRQAPPGGNPETSAFHLQSNNQSHSLPTHCRRVPATRRALPTLCEHARAWLVSTD